MFSIKKSVERNGSVSSASLPSLGEPANEVDAYFQSLKFLCFELILYITLMIITVLFFASSDQFDVDNGMSIFSENSSIFLLI